MVFFGVSIENVLGVLQQCILIDTEQKNDELMGKRETINS
jgi:hypothetical protein